MSGQNNQPLPQQDGDTPIKRRGNWQTSPAGKRILALLQSVTDPLSPQEVAAQVHIVPAYAQTVLRQMHADKAIGVAAWHRNLNGNATPLYLVGVEDVPAPEKYSAAEKCRRYRAAILRDLPEPVAKRVLSALHGNVKVSAVVADGRTVYRRGVGVDRVALSRPKTVVVERQRPQIPSLPLFFPRRA